MPGTSTTALLSATASPRAENAPKMLSRPIIATWTCSPRASLTTSEITPLCGRYARLSVSSTSTSAMSGLRSVARRWGRINSKSSALSEDKNPFGERGAESKAVSCLTGQAGLWYLAPSACHPKYRMILAHFIGKKNCQIDARNRPPPSRDVSALAEYRRGQQPRVAFHQPAGSPGRAHKDRLYAYFLDRGTKPAPTTMRPIAGPRQQVQSCRARRFRNAFLKY